MKDSFIETNREAIAVAGFALALGAASFGGGLTRQNYDEILMKDPNYARSEELYIAGKNVQTASHLLSFHRSSDMEPVIPPQPKRAKYLLNGTLEQIGDLSDIDDILREVAKSIPDIETTKDTESLRSQRTQLDLLDDEILSESERYRSRAPQLSVRLRDISSFLEIGGRIAAIALAGMSVLMFSANTIIDNNRRNRNAEMS